MLRMNEVKNFHPPDGKDAGEVLEEEEGGDKASGKKAEGNQP